LVTITFADWRTACRRFAGLLVALVFKLMVKERRKRLHRSAASLERASQPGEAIHELMGKPAFWLMTARRYPLPRSVVTVSLQLQSLF
jgi:hypothetical protein